MKFIKGDTLIEVAIATGIFSMVAIAVISVVNGSTSSAQSALEVTVAREEIDAQAEALRFIHNSYLIGDDAGTLGSDTGYNKLWNSIVALASVNDNNSSALQYLPPNVSSCSQLYNTSYLKDHGAFILDIKNMSTASTNSPAVLYSAKNNADIFKESTTYPRTVYNSSDVDLNSLVNQGTGNSLIRAEGIFIIPVKDQKSTAVIVGNSSSATKKAAYYDFYIRTCWFGPGADRPSTISTVVRLYDPNVIDF